MEENLSLPATAAPSKAERTDIVRDKVFGTTELLEGILPHVADDFKTLLLSQRVSRVFHNTTEHLTSLQKALFSVKNPSTDPLFPRMLFSRKIKFNQKGAAFCLAYETVSHSGGMKVGIDFSLAYEDMSSVMRSRVDMVDRNCRVAIKFDPENMSAGERRRVECRGSWQKISPNIMKQTASGNKVWCVYGSPRYRHLLFGTRAPPWNTVEFTDGDTLGSIVDKAIRARQSENIYGRGEPRRFQAPE